MKAIFHDVILVQGLTNISIYNFCIGFIVNEY